MNSALKRRFPPFLRETDLRSAIESVCAEFGGVSYLRIFPASGASRPHCACFLRLDSESAAAALKSKFDVVDFHPDIAFLADVAENWAGPTLKAGAGTASDSRPSWPHAGPFCRDLGCKPARRDPQ